MSSRSVGVVTRSLRRQQQANIVGQIPTEHEQDQNDDDVVESTASAFDREAISVQAKCPTCRKDVTAEDLIRVFLPTTE
ncbi:hypothetical protein F2Q69_00039039 [Brassica cretica]|uniref:Uncharacterized protein n=1 Tax=Brassica cretica TaxID=69181 RepID=A0A8S9SQ50_BRACR|nr:hypothetical protein F2Q69_00039039 [Brassica cretica]